MQTSDSVLLMAIRLSKSVLVMESTSSFFFVHELLVLKLPTKIWKLSLVLIYVMFG